MFIDHVATERSLAPEERNLPTFRSSGAFQILCDPRSINIWSLRDCRSGHENRQIADQKSFNRKAVASFPRRIKDGRNRLAVESTKPRTQGSRSGNPGLEDVTALRFGHIRKLDSFSNLTRIQP